MDNLNFIYLNTTSIEKVYCISKTHNGELYQYDYTKHLFYDLKNVTIKCLSSYKYPCRVRYTGEYVTQEKSRGKGQVNANL